VAIALREWLPSVINDLQPWMSGEDIAKGTHWPTQLGIGLADAKFGIICLTPENQKEPSILFEAGAISNAIERSRVSPYLLGIDDRSEVTPPLGHFQATASDEADTLKLLQSINEVLEQGNGGSLPAQRLKLSFKKWWPELSESLKNIERQVASAPEQSKRPDRELLEEILNMVRDLSRSSGRFADKGAFDSKRAVTSYVDLSDLVEKITQNKKKDMPPLVAAALGLNLDDKKKGE
jgi:hypothetical protein